ncbi:MAG: dihydroorotate dehydrogenase catalytic subunit [Gaiellales bacterium]|nr:dihydroorotate dehydrogenase catalytic subunit [Gaiellales bacterium]
MSSPDLATEICGVTLDHPLVNGSGTLDALVAGTLGLSAFVTKTVTLNPRAGNPPPRIAETPAGMVNSIGLANPGLEAFCERHLPRLAELGVPLIVSVGGWSREEYATAVARIGAHPAVAAIELNVSCPNVETGCISIGTDPDETRALLRRCRAETDRPLLAKLSPSVADVAEIADAAADGGAHGLVLINTVRGMALDRGSLRPLLGGGGGGLSGPAVKPMALHAIYHCRAATGLPIIGMGGVSTAQDCIEFLAAGAAVVGVGTSLFRDPGLPRRLLAELPQLMQDRAVSTLGDIIGLAHLDHYKAQREVDANH